MPADSEGGRIFDTYWRALSRLCCDPEHEYRFGAVVSGGTGKGLRARLRQTQMQDWRFDRAWPACKVAVEIDGGNWTGGRHTRGAGFENDHRKINAAQDEGWVVYRYTISMLKRDPEKCVRQIERAIETRA